MIRVAGFAASVLGLLSVVSCGSTPSSSTAPDACEPLETDASAVVHHGTGPHDPVAPGDSLRVEYGVQGGMHVRLAVACAGLEPGSPTLAEGLRNDDLPRVTWSVRAAGELLSNETPRRAVRQEELDGSTLLEPQLVVLRYFESPPQSFDVSEREAELEALTTTVEVVVTDRCGRSAVAARQVQLAFPRDAG